MISKLSILDFLEIYPGDILIEHSLSDLSNIEADCSIRDIKYVYKIPNNQPGCLKAIVTVAQKDFNRKDINRAFELLDKNFDAQKIYLHCIFERRRGVSFFDSLKRLRVIFLSLRKTFPGSETKVFLDKENMLHGAPLFPRYPKKMLSTSHYLSFRFWINEIRFILKALFIEAKISVVIKCP